MLEVIEHLEGLATSDFGPQDPTEGVCDELGYFFGKEFAYDLIRKYAPEWPEYSGDIWFPIPCSFNSPPKNRYTRTENLWIRKYGDKRREFCAWLAEALRAEL